MGPVFDGKQMTGFTRWLRNHSNAKVRSEACRELSNRACLLAFESLQDLNTGLHDVSTKLQEQRITCCRLGPGAPDPIDPERAIFIHKMACSAVTLPQHFSAAATLSRIVPTSSTSAIVELTSAESVSQARGLTGVPFLMADYKPRRTARPPTPMDLDEPEPPQPGNSNAPKETNKSRPNFRPSPRRRLPTNGVGAANTQAVSSHRQGPDKVIPVQQIAQEWTLRDGLYVLQTKKLDGNLVTHNKRCGTSVVNGDCAWDSIYQAGHVRLPSYRDLRRGARDFFNEHKASITSTMYSGPEAGKRAWQQKLLAQLITPGIYMTEPQLRIVAWFLLQDIHISNAYDGVSVIISTGQLPWDPSAPLRLPPIEIAYRCHKVYWAYNQSFEPIAPLEGHYWPVLQITASQGNFRGPGQTRPNIAAKHPLARNPSTSLSQTRECNDRPHSEERSPTAHSR